MTSSANGWTMTTLAGLMAGGVFADGDWVETKDQDENGDVRLTQLADVGVGHWRNRSNRSLTLTSAKGLGCTFLERGDVLVARMPDPLGRACIFPGDSRRAITVVDVCILRPDRSDLDNKWLMWFFNAPQTRAKIETLQSGTTRKRISRKNLGGLQIAVPPIAEQRRAVATIEEYFSRLDAAESALARAVKQIDRLQRSFHATVICSDWPKARLRDVVTSLRNGLFVSRPSPEPVGLRIFRISAVRPGRLDLDDVRFIPNEIPTASDYVLGAGDILFTRYNGNPRFVGACAVVPHQIERTVYPDKLIRAVTDRSKVVPEFLALYLNDGEGRREVEQRLKTTAGQVGISGGQLLDVPVRVPSLDIQQRIVAQLLELTAACDRQRLAIDLSLKRSSRLRQSTLAKAFSESYAFGSVVL